MIMCHRRISNGTRRTPNVSTKALFLFKFFRSQVSLFLSFWFISMEFISNTILRLLCANLANPGQFNVRNNRLCDCSRKRDRKIKRVIAQDRTVTSTSKMNSTWR